MIPSNNVFFESLPKHGFITVEGSTNKYFVWNGHKRGTGRERAVVCWSGQNATYVQRSLNGMAQKYQRLCGDGSSPKKRFGVS